MNGLSIEDLKIDGKYLYGVRINFNITFTYSPNHLKMSIWFKQYTLQDINGLNKNTLNENLGIEFTELNDDSVVAKMPIDDRTVQPFRIMHGGASAALAETLGSVASMMVIDVDKNMPVGLELNINHLGSVREGHVYGTCKPIHTGKSTHVWGIEVKNEAGKLVSIARLTVIILERK